MRRYPCLALVLALAACGDDGDDPATIDQLRVVKVSGDQIAQAPPPSPATASRARVTARVGTDGYTDEPLVARVEADGGAQMSLAGPSFAVVPAGTPVHWHLSDGCGRLFGSTTETDHTAHTVNRWAPGTRAGTCHAAAGRLLPDGTIVLDATWDLEILPGSVDHAASQWPWGKRQIGDTHEPYKITLAGQGPLVDDLWRDIYGNIIPYRIVGTQYVAALGDMFGSEEARMFRLARTDVTPGDTATLRFERQGVDGPELLIDFAVEVLGDLENGAVPVRLTVRQIAQ